MKSRAPIDPSRIRRITGSFSWLDHRLITQGFLAEMTPGEILLYFFLVLVGDKNGVSFYSYDKICLLLKIDVEQFLAARDRLIERELILCENGRFQVLPLPPPGHKHLAKKASRSDTQGIERRRELMPLAEIFAHLRQKSCPASREPRMGGA